MKKGLVAIYRFFEKRPLWMWLLLLLLVAGCALSIFRIHFVEDIGSFLPNDKASKQVNYAYEHLGGDNKLVVSIRMADDKMQPDVEMMGAVADEYAALFERLDTTHLAKSVLAQVDESQMSEVMEFVLDNMPYFLTDEDYRRMDTLLSAQHVQQQLANDKDLLSAPVAMLRPMLQRDPMFFSSNVLRALNDFKPTDSYKMDNGHLFSKDGKEAVVVITSNYPLSETKYNARLVKLMEQTADSVPQLSNGKLRATCFGASQVSITNSTQIKRDSVLAILLSVLLIMALLWYYYRDVRSILLIFVCVGFGGLFALGLISWIDNPVSVIAVGVASIIIGIALNYPIHFLSHFKRTNDKQLIINEVAHPLLIGNLTTVGAFLSLLFISSDAMRDLGLFAALLLVGTILFVLIFLPHLMGDRFKGKNRELAFGRVAEFRLENVRGLFWTVMALTVVFYCFTSKTSFDTNMHHINYMTKEQKAAFEKIRANADTTVQTVYCVAEGADLQQALQNYERTLPLMKHLSDEGKVKRISGIGRFMPSQKMQQRQLQKWNDFWKNRQVGFVRNLDAAAVQNGFTPEAFQPCKDILSADYRVQQPDYFDLIRNQLAANYISDDGDKVLIYTILSVDKRQTAYVETQLDALRHGVFAFTDSSIASRLVDALSKDFNYVLSFCGLLVFLFLFFSFNRLEISLMAFLPLVLAWVWILGIMGIFNIQFNIVNIILATFIFGMGDDYSIFVTEGLIYEYAYGKKMLAQFKNSIILSASIMFIGIGMLIFAKHPAMRSLAEVIIIGMMTVVLMAYIVPPIIFKWLTMRKGKPRRQPVTLRSIGLLLVAIPYFLFGVLVLSIAAVFLLHIGGRTDKHKLQYHRLLRFMLYTTAKIIPATPWRVRNPHNENFDKPAIIICNHQSHTDLLYLLSLTPKVIALTNDWAWNMPLYRRILRNGDYLPANFGIEDNIDKISKMVQKGYSVLVFPEGTRSTNQSVLRFHKGAFYLAEKLQLDVLPIVLHGTDDIFPKGGSMFYPGSVTIDIGARVTLDNEFFRKDKTQLETARLFRKYYIRQYDLLKRECETPDYLAPIVTAQYLYKGQAVEKECRRRLRRRALMVVALEKVPPGARLLYKNCGCGALAFMAARLRRDLQIVAYDSNADAIAVADNCYWKPANLTYTASLTDDADFEFVMDEDEL